MGRLFEWLASVSKGDFARYQEVTVKPTFSKA